VTYWIFSLTVLILGVLTGFSIGAFILPIGLALLVLGPVRKRRIVYWPLLLGVLGFVIGYLLFVPLTCTATAVIPGGTGETVCRAILGPEYRAAGIANPPADTALLAGVIAMIVAAIGTLAALRFAARRRRSPTAAST
jgi:hypothetical protein